MQFWWEEEKETLHFFNQNGKLFISVTTNYEIQFHLNHYPAIISLSERWKRERESQRKRLSWTLFVLKLNDNQHEFHKKNKKIYLMENSANSALEKLKIFMVWSSVVSAFILYTVYTSCWQGGKFHDNNTKGIVFFVPRQYQLWKCELCTRNYIYRIQNFMAIFWVKFENNLLRIPNIRKRSS